MPVPYGGKHDVVDCSVGATEAVDYASLSGKSVVVTGGGCTPFSLLFYDRGNGSL